MAHSRRISGNFKFISEMNQTSRGMSWIKYEYPATSWSAPAPSTAPPTTATTSAAAPTTSAPTTSEQQTNVFAAVSPNYSALDPHPNRPCHPGHPSESCKITSHEYAAAARAGAELSELHHLFIGDDVGLALASSLDFATTGFHGRRESGYSSAGDLPATPVAALLTPSHKVEETPEDDLWPELLRPDVAKGGLDSDEASNQLLDYVESCVVETSRSHRRGSASLTERRGFALTVDIDAARSGERHNPHDQQRLQRARATATAAAQQNHSSGGDTTQVRDAVDTVCKPQPPTAAPAVEAQDARPNASNPPRHGGNRSKHPEPPAVRRASQAGKASVGRGSRKALTAASTSVSEKRRKMDGNRLAAKKFRMKQKAKVANLMAKCAELEQVNAQLVEELAAVRQLQISTGYPNR